MGMFNVVTDSFKGEISDLKVKRQGLIAGTVYAGFERSCPRDSKNVSYVDVGLI